MLRARVSNSVVVIAVQARGSAVDVGKRLLRFLQPHFFTAVQDAEPDFSLDLVPFDDAPRSWQAPGGMPTVMRRSPARRFDLRGRTFMTESGQITIDLKNRTAFELDRDRQVRVYVSEHSDIHLLEFTRALALMVEEARGSLVLHASATVHERGCVLALGPKAAGKTTAMLELVFRHGHRHLTGDKALVRASERGVDVRGWPDYPYIGRETLLMYERVADACDVPLADLRNRTRAGEKLLIEPTRFRNTVPHIDNGDEHHVSGLLFPDVRSPTSGIRWLDGVELTNLIEQCIERPHEHDSVQWHSLLPEIRAQAQREPPPPIPTALLRVPSVSVSGPMPLPHAVVDRMLTGFRSSGRVKDLR